MIFELQGELSLDPKKKTIAFMDKGDHEGYTHVYGAARVIKEKLRDQFNIITIGAGCGLTNNYYEIKRQVTKRLLRKSDNLEYLQLNYKSIDVSMRNSFKDLPELEYIILGTDDMFRIPLIKYASKKMNVDLHRMQNEFFDYMGSDPKVLEQIDFLNNKVVTEWDILCSPISFSTQDYSLFMRAIDFINRTKRLKKSVIGFSIDPAIYTPFFEKLNIPAHFYYFADDKRGTRKFKKLDIAQLQHIIYDNQFKPPGFDNWDEPLMEKTHNMFFAGTIFQTKGTRRFIWDEFLKNVRDEKSSFYVPLRKNGINKANNNKSEQRHNALVGDDDFSELYRDVTNHPNFKGSLLPHELNERTQRYKYGMIFRCVSINDSLNFRPVLYAYRDILPFFDYQYDPAYLQVPKSIQDRLIVRSAEDIQSKIEYFNAHDDERLELLEELKQLFEIHDYINKPESMINREIKKIIPEYHCQLTKIWS